MCSLSRIALRLPSSALHLPCLQSLPVSTLCGDSVLSVPVMSQHMDAYLRFQGSGPGYQKAQSVQAKIKIKGFFMVTKRVSSASSLWNIQYQSFGKYLAKEWLLVSWVQCWLLCRQQTLCKKKTDPVIAGWWRDKGRATPVWMFVILVGILFNKFLPYLSLFRFIALGPIKGRPQIWTQQWERVKINPDSSIKMVPRYFGFFSKDQSEAPVVFD